VLHVIDFEDGLQDYIGKLTQLPYVSLEWDTDGEFNDVAVAEKTIVVMSKPFDCLVRGEKKAKYPSYDMHLMGNWSRRNYRYTNSEIYERISNFCTSNSNIFVIHPYKLLTDDTVIDRLSKYLGTNEINFDLENYKDFYDKNVNQR